MIKPHFAFGFLASLLLVAVIFLPMPAKAVVIPKNDCGTAGDFFTAPWCANAATAVDSSNFDDGVGTTFGYLPTQYWVISDTPNLSFSLWDGYLDQGGRTTSDPDYIYPNSKAFINGNGNRHMFWEVYQLENGNGGDGRGSPSGKPIATLDAQGMAQLNWSTFNYNTTTGVSAGKKFNSFKYPQYNGKYIFLVKGVMGSEQAEENDRGHGYLADIGAVSGNGENANGAYACPTPLGGEGDFKCPFRLIDTRWSFAAPPEHQGPVVRNGHYISSAKVVTAPMRYAINIAPRNWKGNDVRHDAQPLDIPPRGAGNCGRSPARITNADWDYDTNEPDSDQRTHAVIDGKAGGGSREVNNQFEISQGWSRGSAAMDLSSLGLTGGAWAQLEVKKWGGNNNLYVGGTQFGGGIPPCTGPPPPPCPTTLGWKPFGVWMGSPFTNSNGCFEYNGDNAADGGSRLGWGTLFFSPGPQYIWYQQYLFDENGNGTKIYDVGGWQNVGAYGLRFVKTPYDIGTGTVRWQSCVASTNNPNSVPGFQCAESLTTINKPPVSEAIAPPSNTPVNYVCSLPAPLQARVTDANSSVQTTFYLTWSGGSLVSDESVPRASGDVITSDQVTVYGGQKTLSEAIRDPNIIPEGADVSWHVVSHDLFGASDATNDRRFGSAINGWGLAWWYDNTGYPVSQTPTQYKRGPASNTLTFHKNTRPNLMAGHTKVLKDQASDQPITGLADGQSAKVELTFTNTGQTPTNRIQVIDYMGPVRDFERPRDFAIKRPGYNEPMAPNVSEMIPNPDHNQTDWGPGDGADRGKLAYKIDFGDIPQALNPGESLTLFYYIRANRNQGANLNNPVGDGNSNYGQGVNLGETSPGANPNYRQQTDPKTGQPTGGLINELSDAHTYVAYQENYCDPAQTKVPHFTDWSLGSILSGYLRGGRGSIGSNANAYGYDGRNGNATFTVTAGGNLSHFTGGNGAPGSTFGQYQAGATFCNGGIDWRSKMIENIQKLRNGAHVKAGSPNLSQLTPYFDPLTQTLDFNKINATDKAIEITGDLTIDADVKFKGAGTLLVDGNLIVKKKMTYDADATVNSLGVIVLGAANGGLFIDPAVTQMVGSYYVSDVDFSQPGDCPTLDPSKGIIDTSWLVSGNGSDAGSSQLNVDGLLVGRQFELNRYLNDAQSATAVENVYYDGRVVATTPPGFGTFSETKWYEIPPG